MGTPLEGIRVLDFTSLLPGPLATLMLAEAGADVLKIERPDRGDEMRSYTPKFGTDSVNFALLNRGKQSIAIDLKDPARRQRFMALVQQADVLVEQFRPGVMDRLGLGYEALRTVNPGLIYCSISGYGQSGSRAAVAGHDLNYVAETGLLSLASSADGTPVVPAALVADIGGGTYPAVVNILLALLRRERTGEGAFLDIALADNVFPFLYWAIGNGLAAGQWPSPGGDLVTGGSPRYNVYRTADGQFVAAAPLEDRFWEAFCNLLGLDEHERDDAPDPEATKRVVASRIAEHPAGHWRARFSRQDVCCAVVRTVREALEDPQFRERGLFDRMVEGEAGTITALPMPLEPALRRPDERLGYPPLGNANSLLD
jgi:alpha-methylacyl-CoA racemase